MIIIMIIIIIIGMDSYYQGIRGERCILKIMCERLLPCVCFSLNITKVKGFNPSIYYTINLEKQYTYLITFENVPSQRTWTFIKSITNSEDRSNTSY